MGTKLSDCTLQIWCHLICSIVYNKNLSYVSPPKKSLHFLFRRLATHCGLECRDKMPFRDGLPHPLWLINSVKRTWATLSCVWSKIGYRYSPWPDVGGTQRLALHTTPRSISARRITSSAFSQVVPNPRPSQLLKGCSIVSNRCPSITGDPCSSTPHCYLM